MEIVWGLSMGSWIFILVLAISFVGIIAMGALGRADRALGLTTWTDPDTIIFLKVLKERLEKIDEEKI